MPGAFSLLVYYTQTMSYLSCGHCSHPQACKKRGKREGQPASGAVGYILLAQ